MRSPNLKLDFFTSEPGLPLQIFRKSEIASIREHLLSFISSTKHAETKNRYKKIVLVVGSSGTGKSSSIKMVLDEINGFLLGNLKEFGDLEMLRVIYMNANSSYNC
jgi:Cdc6-like AAA superfamily ATPase